MDQSQAELIIRAIKQTLNDTNRHFEHGIGDADQLIRRLQRFEALISSFTFQDEEYQQRLVDSLHDICVELATDSDSDEETQSNLEAQSDASDESTQESLPEVQINKLYNGMICKSLLTHACQLIICWNRMHGSSAV